MFKLMYCIPLLFLAGCSPEENRHSAKTREEKIHQIDEKLEILNKEWNREEKQDLKNEVESQDAMLMNYHKFAEELKKSESEELKAQALKKEIQQLESEKQALLKQ